MRHTSCWFCVLAVLAAGCASNTIEPARELPRSTPWDLKALSAPPEFEWVEAQGPVRSLLYKGEEHGGRPTRVFAYYATPGTLAGDPSKDKRLPGIVLVHGGGGTAFREWAEMWAKRGYAAIAMDLQGNRPSEGLNPHEARNRTRLPDGGPLQVDENIFLSIDKSQTEHWPYHAVSNVTRAHSLLRSLPEVDARRTAITGISWGGYLTCIVASLDNRFKAAVPVYGCGFLGDNSAWKDGPLAKLTPEQREKWLKLYDPSSYLPACRVPIFFVNGTNDFAYPLDSYMKSYKLVPGEKNIRVTVNMPHGHPPGWEPKEIGVFVDQHLKGAVPLPQIHLDESGEIAGQHGFGLATVACHYTLDAASPINKRAWQTTSVFAPLQPVILEPWKSMSANNPKDATAWFITVTDDRGATVSSEVVIKK